MITFMGTMIVQLLYLYVLLVRLFPWIVIPGLKDEKQSLSHLITCTSSNKQKGCKEWDDYLYIFFYFSIYTFFLSSNYFSFAFLIFL